MVDQKIIFEYLNHAGVDFMTGVPDSYLNDFCLYADAKLQPDHHVIAANEGNAVALAAGYYLATGNIPLVYMQNSGLSNALSPLLSLNDKNVYSIPVILLIGWRGDPRITDRGHHKRTGEVTPLFLEAMDVPYRIVDDNDEEVLSAAKWAVSTAKRHNTPVSIIARKGVFAKKKKKVTDEDVSKKGMSRENAIDIILKNLPADTIYIATTGRATREIYKLRELHGSGHELDFLNVGSMGHASSIAVGIALARKDRYIVCLDGDGAAIMHLGALTTTGVVKPTNFLHVILNNGIHESVGGQPSAGFKVNLTAIAENSGYKTVRAPVNNEQTLLSAVKKLSSSEGPAFIDIHLRKGAFPPLLKISLIDLKNDFMKTIQKSHKK